MQTEVYVLHKRDCADYDWVTGGGVSTIWVIFPKEIGEMCGHNY